MSLAWISLWALVIAVGLSCLTRVNVGVVSLAFAWIIGVQIGGWSLNELLVGFPTQLFVTLAGVMLLFGMAQANGTLERIAARAVRLCRGNLGVIPVMFFAVALGMATIGPGNVATAALLAPMAMAVAARTGIPAFLMAIMVGNGAQAGALSPFAPTGVIANGVMARIGLAGAEWYTYASNLAAHALVAGAGYLVFGGWRLFGRRPTATDQDAVAHSDPLDWRHWLTVTILAALIAGVVFWALPVGMAALAGAALLSLAGAADEREAFRRMPWPVIVMVCGVTVLIALLEKTGGMDLFTALLARLATAGTVTAVVAFVTGVVSIYSSTSGVVLPAFLPTVPGLVARLGGGDPLAVASSINVGAHLVDLSPLSTTGAICLAAAPASVEPRKLFVQLLAWGVSMAAVGPIICWALFR
jgi:Na+/H+ antiporter NhaD/arsenite permease-like protein